MRSRLVILLLPALILIAQAQEKAKTFYQMGLEHLKQGRYEEARKVLLLAVAENPRNASAHGMLAIACDKLGLYDEAVRNYAKAIELEPSSATHHNNLAIHWAMRGKPELALEEFRRALKLDPNSRLALYNAGLILLEQNRPEEAANHLEKARRLEPRDPEVLFSLARAHLALDRKDLCEARLKELVSFYPESQDFRIRSAELAIEAGLLDLAENLLAAHPQLQRDHRYYRQLGWLRYRQRRFPEAEAEFRRALEIKSSPETLIDLGWTYIRLDRWTEAGGAFEKALQIEPENVAAVLGMAYAHIQNGRFEQGIALCSKAIAQDPANFLALYYRGMALLLGNDLERAEADFKRVTELRSDFPLAYYRIGYIYNQRRQYQQAIAWLLRAAELAPDHSEIRYQLAQAYQRSGQIEKARQQMEIFQRLPRAAEVDLELRPARY